MKQGLLKRQQQQKERKAQDRKGKSRKSDQLPPNYERQVDQLTAMAMSIIYSDKSKLEEKQLPQALEDSQASISQPDDAVANAVGDVALWVLSTVEDHVQASGQKVLPIVVMGAIGRITSEVAELTQAAGLAQMTEEDVQIAISVAINKYIPEARRSGKVTDRQLKEAAAALQKAYPEEAAAFQQMVKARLERQKQQAGSQALPVEQAQQPMGLLGGNNG